MSTLEPIRSRLWSEEPEPGDPFAARVCRCAGYDVYGEILARGGYFDYLYLLFQGERPTRDRSRVLERLAVALANPGLRDYSVRAAMNAGVGGSNGAAALMAALAVGAGQYAGAREVWLACESWQACGTDLDAWRRYLAEPPAHWTDSHWPAVEHTPGFEPYLKVRSLPVTQTLTAVAHETVAGTCWLRDTVAALESVTGRPLAMSGVAAATFAGLGLAPDQAEMLYLMLRLPGAAAHALEQKAFGWRHYPFFKDGLELAE